MSDPTSNQPTVLIVDDVPENLVILGGILQKDYRVRVATDAVHALGIIESDTPPDLVLLDVMMPGMSGYEVCQRVKENPRCASLPIIFVTALGEVEDEEHGLAIGAVDYLTKPVVPVIVAARVRTHVELAAARKAIARQNELLSAAVRERTLALSEAHEDLKESYLQAIDLAYALMSQADDWLGHHCRRVATYALRIAYRLGLDEQTTFDLRIAAMLHDLGLLGMAKDSVEALLQLGKPSREDHPIYWNHPVAQLQGLTASAQFRRTAKLIAGHHEYLDGTGFPGGLSGDAIPLGSRILAAADRWDVFTQMEPIATERPHVIDEFLTRYAGKLDGAVLVALAEEVRQGDPFSRIVDRVPAELEPGMVVATAFRTPQGSVLLRSGTTLRRDHIEAIQNLVAGSELQRPLQVYRRGLHPS